jgi:ParB family chromosome partitioning protein
MSKPSTPLKIDLLPLSELIANSQNPKLHPSEQVEQITASIEKFGFNDPIAIAENNEIIEGHGRLLAAQKLGLKSLPVIRLNHLTPAERKAYALAHNKLTLNSGWDVPLLRLEIEAIQDLDASLSLDLTGFRDIEIETLFNPGTLPDSEPDLDESILGESSPVDEQNGR